MFILWGYGHNQHQDIDIDGLQIIFLGLKIYQDLLMVLIIFCWKDNQNYSKHFNKEHFISYTLFGKHMK